MKIRCVGVNWKTPIAVRERVAFDESARARALRQLRQSHADGEFVILSTCNRTEIYSASGTGSVGPGSVQADDLVRFLSDFHDISHDEFLPHLYVLEGEPAVLHLFEVAGGLDSLVLGEGQILGQVREAYQSATEIGSAGPVTHQCFQKALYVAKRIHSETSLSKGRLSIASAAVDYIKGVFDVFRDKCVLIIGAGKMAELTATHLSELTPARVLVTNRSVERAEELARRFGGQAWPFDRLHDAMCEADIIISSTAAEQPIVQAKEFAEVMKTRRQRLIAIVDIAVPRDFDDAIGELANVLLWNIDDLEQVRKQTVRSRKSELQSAYQIISEERDHFHAALAVLESGPIITQLELEYQRIIDDELRWLLPQLNGLSSAQEEKIRHFAHRIKNKLLHPPKRAIREDARQGDRGVLDMVQRLFGLGGKSAAGEESEESG